MTAPLMPKATAVWLVENTTLTFRQISVFCEIHELEIQAMADGDVSGNIRGLSPIDNGQLTWDEIHRCEVDKKANLVASEMERNVKARNLKAKKILSPSQRQDKPNAIAWVLKNYPQIKELIILMVLLFLIIPIFSACSKIETMMIVCEDGAVEETVSVEFNQSEIELAGLSYAQVVEDVEYIANVQIDFMIDTLNDKVKKDLMLLNDSESVEVLSSYYNGIEKVVQKRDVNKLYICAKFKSVDVYKYFYNIKSSSKVEHYTEEHFFYDKVYYYSNTSFLKHYELFKALKQYFSDKYPAVVETSGTQLLYTYKTESRREHSDADYVVEQDGYYYHTWVVDSDNVEKQIMFYYNIANAEIFIVLGIAISIGVGASLIVISQLIKKNRK